MNDGAPLRQAGIGTEYDCLLTLGFLLEPNGELTSTLQARVSRAIDHRLAGRAPKLVMSGGRAENEPCASAEAMRDFAVNAGVSPADILMQGDSLDTVGEAIFCRLLLPSHLLGKDVLIVTSEFHADRAKAIFEFVFGDDFCVHVDRVPNGPAIETKSTEEETRSMERFQQLFKGIASGDLTAIADQFWRSHSLYQGPDFDDLRQRTNAALVALRRRQ